MSTSMLLGLFDWIGDFFKSLFDLIPKIMYLLYASMACVLDVLQLFFRKLAGLDVYYVDGKPITGDIVTNFITGILGINKDNLTYSALSTVFWSMIVFGIIICFACTIVAIIKSHYSYDEKAAKGPMQYVYTAGKAIINMVAVPIIVVLGLYVSEAILTALDMITSTNSGSIKALYGTEATSLLCETETMKGDTTMIYYDIFGAHSGVIYGAGGGESANEKGKFALIASTTQPFSGSLFKVAAFNGNRARLGQLDPAKGGFTGAQGSSLSLFAKAGNDKDVLADMIDTAFACNLHAKSWFSLDYTANDVVSMRYFTNYLTLGTNSFSKFNVGLVWYYYDLWQFNFIVGFAGIIVCISIFINVILGLITRLFMCIVLFLVAPPLFGLAPLDGGKAGKGWRENFMKQALMAYGAVVGMNLVLMILPYMNDIEFFNITIADYFAQILVIIVGLITIKAVIATLSGLIGAADANETGGKIKDEVGDVAGKATKMTIGAAKIGGKIGGKVGMRAGGLMAKGLGATVGKLGFTDSSGVRHTLGGAATGLIGGAARLGGKAADLAGKGLLKLGDSGIGRSLGLHDVAHRLVDGKIKVDENGNAITKKVKAAGTTATDLQAYDDKKGYGIDSAGHRFNKNREELEQDSNGNWKAKDLRDKNGNLEYERESGKGIFSLASAKLNFAGSQIQADGLGTALNNTLREASRNIKLGGFDRNGKKQESVLSGAMSLFHDTLIKNDSGLSKFNDSSGIKKKPEHDKATAENTAALLKSSQEQKQELSEVAKAIKELSSKLGGGGTP